MSDFSFLDRKWPELAELSELAEANLYSDANTTMIKLRMFVEQIVDYIFAYDDLEKPEEDNLNNKLKLLEREELIEGKVAGILHALRKNGNKAVHEYYDSLEQAKTLLSLCYKLSVWFMQVYGEWDFSADDYQLPRQDTEKTSKIFDKNDIDIIKQLQSDIAKIKARQDLDINQGERIKKGKKCAKQIVFTGEEDKIIQITKENDETNSIDSAYKFITTDAIDADEEPAYKKVWDSVRKAYSGRKCLAYWRYPLFSKKGEKRSEPDIIIVDKEFGVIVLNIRKDKIDNISHAEYDRWKLKTGEISSPLLEVEDQLYALKGLYQENRSLRSIYEKAAVVLPEISKSDWLEKGFDDKNFIFGNQLGSKTFLNMTANIEANFGNSKLDDRAWEDILMALTGQVTFREKGQDKKETKGGLTVILDKLRGASKTRAEVKNTIKEDLFSVDMQQEAIGKTIPPGPQRIRGIAGSGKTVLLAQKAAHMHLKHPDWKIALIFFTRSLYDNVLNEVNKWLKRFSNGDIEYNPNENKNLQILHAWGAKDQPGFYREVCQAHNARPLSAGTKKLKESTPNGKLIQACKFFLKDRNDIQQIYDAILIDEAQDLVIDKEELKYEDKQSFYWLAYKTLKPLDNGERRLIWAYDEAQSLNSLNIPTATQLFGESEEFKRMVSGFHEGGIRKSEIMNKCYRTPGPVLTAAHAIGMGLLRPEGMIRGFTNQEDWENIGYEVLEGSFNPPGQKVVLHRPKEMTPNRVTELWPDDVIKFNKYNKRKEELNALAKNIKYNINEDGLNPSRDLLIIVLGPPKEAFRLKVKAAKTINDAGIDIYIPKALKNNIFYPKYPNVDPDKFWNKGGVTVSHTYRAKGNEAYMVYVIGLDMIAENEDDFALRNQLFVALTRTKGWLHVSGIGNYPMYKEFEEVLSSGNIFEFEFQRPSTRKKSND